MSANKKNRRDSLAPKLLLLLTVSFFCLLGGELYLRYFHPIRGVIYQLDDRCLFKHIPDSRKNFSRLPVNGGGRVLVKINHQGRRGELVQTNVARRVVAYGDSFIAAEYAELPDTFVCRLEAKLETKLSQPVQVINAGITGYGPDQISLRLEEDLPALKPSLVIIALFAGNDFGDLLRDKIYRLDDQQHLTTNRYVLDASLAREFAAARKPSWHLVRALQLVWERWHPPPPGPDASFPTIKAYLEDCVAQRKAEYEDYIVQGNNSVTNLFRDAHDADLDFEPDAESSRYRRLLMERVLERIKDLAAAQGVPLLLLIIPSPFDVVDHYAAMDAADFPQFERARLTDIVEQLARKLDIPFLNLFGPLRGHENNSSLFYQGGDNHWNTAGQEFAAELMTEEILRAGFLR